MKGVRYQNYLPVHSGYVSVRSSGKTWHLFDISTVPLGRVAQKTATFIQGKHKPVYVPNRAEELGDNVVIVNASKIKTTGAKKLYKLYKHHTGYPGGLKTKTFKSLLETNPSHIINQAVSGMLPKNFTRKKLLESKIWIFDGPFHDKHAQGLPQFLRLEKPDPNPMYGFEELTPETHEIVAQNGEPPKTWTEGFDVKIDEKIHVPFEDRDDPQGNHWNTSKHRASTKHDRRQRKLLRRYKEFK